LIITQHYLYYVSEDGHGMILIEPQKQPGGKLVYEWLPHSYINDYRPPFLLSLEQATALLEQEGWGTLDMQIGDWVSITRCQQNQHKWHSSSDANQQ
jgi:hypothetical protein